MDGKDDKNVLGAQGATEGEAAGQAVPASTAPHVDPYERGYFDALRRVERDLESGIEYERERFSGVLIDADPVFAMRVAAKVQAWHAVVQTIRQWTPAPKEPS